EQALECPSLRALGRLCGELRIDHVAHELRAPDDVKESDPSWPPRRRTPLAQEALERGEQLPASVLKHGVLRSGLVRDAPRQHGDLDALVHGAATRIRRSQCGARTPELLASLVPLTEHAAEVAESEACR